MGDLGPGVAAIAKAELQAAISEYFATVEPGVYVAGWALVTHKESISLSADDKSAVGLLEQTGQTFPLTRGMLEIAIDSHRSAAQPIGPHDLD